MFGNTRYACKPRSESRVIYKLYEWFFDFPSTATPVPSYNGLRLYLSEQHKCTDSLCLRYSFTAFKLLLGKHLVEEGMRFIYSIGTLSDHLVY